MPVPESKSGRSASGLDVSRVSRAEWLAEVIARRVEQEGLVAGARVGTKTELCRRYDVATVTVNQAVRMLASRGMVEIRPGSRGGIFVAGSSPYRVLDQVILGFQWSDASFEHCRQVRSALEPLTVVEAARHRTSEDLRSLKVGLRELRNSLDSPQKYLKSNFALHRRIAQIGGSALLKALYGLLSDFFERRFELFIGEDQDCRGNYEIHETLVRAIEAGDEDEAIRVVARHERHMLGLQRVGQESRLRGEEGAADAVASFRDRSGFPASSFGAAVARQLERDIAGGAWLAGERIGTREQLRRRFDVSVGTINEAVRLAEARGLVVSRSGQGGGLFVTAASTRLRRHLAVDYVGDQDSKQTLLDLRDALEPLICRDAAPNCGPRDAEALRGLLARMRDAAAQPDAYMIQNWNLHRRVAQCVRNPPLHSLYLIVLDAMEGTMSNVEYLPQTLSRHLALHYDLVEAVIAGDPIALEDALSRHATGPLRAVSYATDAAPGPPERLTSVRVNR